MKVKRIRKNGFLRTGLKILALICISEAIVMAILYAFGTTGWMRYYWILKTVLKLLVLKVPGSFLRKIIL